MPLHGSAKFASEALGDRIELDAFYRNSGLWPTAGESAASRGAAPVPNTARCPSPVPGQGAAPLAAPARSVRAHLDLLRLGGPGLR
jgi:hypothetical protein